MALLKKWHADGRRWGTLIFADKTPLSESAAISEKISVHLRAIPPPEIATHPHIGYDPHAMTQPDATQLRDFLLAHFSLDELMTLCFNLGVEFEDLGGEGRAGKARELVKAMQRQGRLDHLAAHLSLALPDLYRKKFHDLPAIPIVPSHVTRNPRQIFISHAHQDAAFAQRLAADLRVQNYPIWIAPDSIIIGEDWPDAIDRGMDGSGVVLLTLTPHARASYWVGKETSAARYLEGQKLVHLVLLDLAECEIPSLWHTYQKASFRDSYDLGLNQLLAWLKRREVPFDDPNDAERMLSSDTRPVSILPPGEPLETNHPSVSSIPLYVPAKSQALPSLTDRRINEQQRRQLQALATEIAKELGRQSGTHELRAVYRRFNHHFGLSGYRHLPQRRIEEGLAFLTTWRNEVTTSAQADRNVSKVDNQTQPIIDDKGLKSRLDGIRRTTTIVALPRKLEIRTHKKTGVELIRIPAGSFLYGSGDSDEVAWNDEKPQISIELPEFWIGRYPITNAEFARFVRETGYRTIAEIEGTGRALTDGGWQWVVGANWLHPGGPATSSSGKGRHPVVQVTWEDAQAFCNWAGLALPTEEQWEKAARGTGGFLWPWGNEPPTEGHCNFGGEVGDTTPVGMYSNEGQSDSPYGCADMAGNVWEWTSTWYEEGKSFILRGGSWLYGIRYTRVACRHHYDYDYRIYCVGFRVVGLLLDPGY